MESNKSIHRSDHQKTLYKALVDAYESDKLILDTYGGTVMIKRHRDDQDKDEEPSAGSNGSKRRRDGKEPESTSAPKEKTSKSSGKSKKGSKYHHMSIGKSAQAEEPIYADEDLEGPAHQEFNTGFTEDQPVDETTQHHDAGSEPTKPLTPDRTQSSFNEFLATPIDFSTFIMNRLKIENLTQDVLTYPTYDLMKGTCKSVVELEYHLEEVFKATNDQLDWHNPEGRTYPHDLSKPLPLILNARGRQVIPYDHFINTDLEYLKGGSLSQRYTTSITKTKAADYGQVKWIEDKVPGRIWSLEKLFTTSMLTGEHITRSFGRDHCKLTNLNLEERFALNVALRMYTRRIVIQECVEGLQLGVESYQKKINLLRPDTYRSDLRKMIPYTAYPYIQGIIYQDDMNINHLMCTEELHKFNDGTLNHVCTALNDIAIGIQMKYLPKRMWSKQDKQKARVMINAIDKKLIDRRLMRSLEEFVGGRLYRGDLRLLERTI
ncbi:hypothetical protein Tco_0884328 [Tanacetum coccineum]